jgi:hypothetical protein
MVIYDNISNLLIIWGCSVCCLFMVPKLHPQHEHIYKIGFEPWTMVLSHKHAIWSSRMLLAHLKPWVSVRFWRSSIIRFKLRTDASITFILYVFQTVTLLDFLSSNEIYLSDLNLNLYAQHLNSHNHADHGSVLHWDFVPQIIARCLEFDCPLISFILISCSHIHLFFGWG